MNIGIFTDTYYPHINGVVTSVSMLKNELERKGHSVFIITTTDPDITQKKPCVFRLPSMPFIFLPTHRMTFLYPPKTLLNMRKLKLDIIHTQTEFPIGIFGKIVSEFYKIPYIHTYHTMYEDYVHYVANGHLITPKMARKFSRIFCNRARIVVAPVEKTKNYLAKCGVIRPIEVIPTGIDFTPFKRGKYSIQEINDAKKEIGLNIDDPVIVYVGRVAKEKSLDVIIKAMPELLEMLPDAKLAIVGNGPLIEELKKLAKDKGVLDSVLFCGSRPWDIIGKYYQIGDVFTTASTSETQGLTYLEAMSAKVLVVAKKDPSTEGLIEDGKTGYFFGENEEVAHVLYKALTDKETSEKIAENAFNSIQWLSSEKFAENIENLYTKVIEDMKEEKKKGNKILSSLSNTFSKLRGSSTDKID